MATANVTASPLLLPLPATSYTCATPIVIAIANAIATASYTAITRHPLQIPETTNGTALPLLLPLPATAYGTPIAIANVTANAITTPIASRC